MKNRIARATVVAAAIGVAAQIPAVPALAYTVRSAPYPSISHYISQSQMVTTNDSTFDTTNPMFKLGYHDGGLVGSRCADLMAALDFGQVGRHGTTGAYNGYGTYLTIKNSSGSYPWETDARIAGATFQYAAGWYLGTGNCSSGGTHLKLLVGTNNYNVCAGDTNCGRYAAGQQWGQVVANVVHSVDSNGWQNQVYIWAGVDVEPAYDSYAHTKSFYSGFQNNDPVSARIYDYGSPESGHWASDSDIACIAYYCFQSSFAAPLVITSTMGSRWVAVARAGVAGYDGVMTNCPYGNELRPSVAWNTLYSDMENAGFSPQNWNTGFDTGMPYASDFGGGCLN
jgi:hypothetical protein